MKKLKLVLISLLLVLSLASCSGQKDDQPQDDMGLEDMMNKITQGLDLPASDTFPIKKDKEEFEYYTFTTMRDDLEAVASEALISTNAHSLVLLKGKDTEEIAKDIANNANIRKWICVEAEIGKVLYTDKYILTVMTYKDNYQGIVSNFESLVGKDKLKSLDIASASQE